MVCAGIMAYNNLSLILHQTAILISSLAGVVKCAHQVIITVEVVLLVVAEGDLAAAVLGEEDSLSLLDCAGSQLPVVEGLAGPNCNHNTKVKLLLLALREKDTALGLGQGLGLLNEDAVHKRTKFLEGDHL